MQKKVLHGTYDEDTWIRMTKMGLRLPYAASMSLMEQ